MDEDHQKVEGGYFQPACVFLPLFVVEFFCSLGITRHGWPFSVIPFFFLCLLILEWGFRFVAVYNFVCVCVYLRATLTKQKLSNCLNF